MQVNVAADSFFPIRVPKGDPHFDPDSTGDVTLRLRRSIYSVDTGT